MLSNQHSVCLIVYLVKVIAVKKKFKAKKARAHDRAGSKH